MDDARVKLGHGSGGLLSHRLVKDVILAHLKNTTLRRLEDAAQVKTASRQLAFTTDSYVVNPLFFPGGDIGKLAVCGTVNDLAMKGAVPEYLSFAMILEEGFLIADLVKVLASVARTARQADVAVVCGDTKVVERGKADGMFITTSGVGAIEIKLGKERIKDGDLVIISGTIGDHGIVIMNERLKLGLRSRLKSDCAPLNRLTVRLHRYRDSLHCMRDPTRGGVVAVLNEMIEDTDLGILLREETLPLKKEVVGASEILGIDPLYIANEGKFVAVVARDDALHILKTIRSHPLGKHAAIIGEVVKKPKGVWLTTTIGGTHPLLQLEAEGLPRIC